MYAVPYYGGMKDQTDKRVITPMPADLLKRIDDYRFTARLPSRAEAIRELIGAGLAAKAAEAQKRKKGG